MANVERIGSHRILKGTAADLEITVYSDGTKTDPSDAAVSAVDATGAAVTLGAAAIVGSNSGRVTAAILPAATANVGRITATWTLTVGGVEQSFETYHDVVGDLLFTEAELRAYGPGSSVANAKFTDAQILAMHDLVKDSFEARVGAAFGLTFEREILSGSDLVGIYLRRPKVYRIRAVAVRSGATWTALTVDELAALFVDDFGRLEWESAVWPRSYRNIRVDYEHGYQPIPPEIKNAAMMLAKEWLVGSNIPARATTQIDQSGQFTLATPGLRGSIYGVPLVDEVINKYAALHYLPGIG